MRIVIVKLSHEKATNCGEVLDIGDMSYARLGEECRAEIRYLDLKPFDSYAYGNLSLTPDQFNALDPARIYELNIAPIPPALFFDHCQTCDNLLPDNQHTGTCDGCIPF